MPNQLEVKILMESKLFETYKLGNLEIKNRIVMAPMTRCRSGNSGVPSELTCQYYAQRATSGLIITEGVPVSQQAMGYLWTPRIDGAEHVTGWSKVTNAVHKEEGVIFMQIWHVGRVSHTSLQPDGIAPEGPTSDQPDEAVCFAYQENGQPGYVPTSQPQALNEEGLERIKAEFVQAARNARQAGFDGVEIHGANGYLFDQFLNSVVNTRSDDYGGNVENRCRFLLDVVKAVGEEIGFARTGVRISPNGRFNDMPEDPEMEETFVYLAKKLHKMGVVYLHINDQTTFELPGIPEGMIEKIREVFPGTIILCGGYNKELADQALDSGLADLIAFGVPYLANPDLPARMKNGWPLNDADRETFYGGAEKGFTDYPTYQANETEASEEASQAG
ncbi:MAG: alkene reductase [Gammaproteobacteria bacterium]